MFLIVDFTEIIIYYYLEYLKIMHIIFNLIIYSYYERMTNHMGKKKNKKNNGKHNKTKKSIMLLSEIDTSMNTKYESLIEEIQEMQLKINIADAKAMKKQRKKMIRHDMGVIPYYVSKDKVKAREKALKQMEQTNFLGRVEETLKNLTPCVVIIARLVAALILAILSIEPFKRLIKPDMLDRLSSVYNIAMAIK